jgi:1,2-diacylglycerol 3-beta-galactosyltransferase
LKGSQRSVLFLIADTGAGHRSAANALRTAIEIIAEEEQRKWLNCQREGADVGVYEPPTYRIEIVDVFEQYSRFPLREAIKLYGPAIRYNPSIYGRIFHMSNHAQTVAAVQTVAGPMVRNGLLRLITNVQPDVIVSIHPMLNHITVEAIKELGMKIPLLTVVTDLISVHYAWYAPGVDEYIVPTEQACSLYLKRGLEPEKVYVLGMPIDPKFTVPMPSKEELQRRLGLVPNLPVILLVGGGDGTGGLRWAVQAISHARLPVQLLVITGRNKRLFLHLQRLRASLKVSARIFGFVNNMPEMMRAADVIVTKAGPGTICEALACDLPIVLSGYVPGQEEGNVTFVVEKDVGVMTHNSVEMIDALRRLIKPGSQVMSRQLANARLVSRPRASFDIAAHILGHLPRPGEPGIWQGANLSRTVRWQNGRRVAVLRPHGPGFTRRRRAAVASLHRLRGNIRHMNFLQRVASPGRSSSLRANAKRPLPGQLRRIKDQLEDGKS